MRIDGLTGQPDFVALYLRYVFKTIGITGLQALPLGNLMRGAATQTITQIHVDTWSKGFSAGVEYAKKSLMADLSNELT